MAAVRHLEFEKITVSVTWPRSACDPSFLEFAKKFDFLLNIHHGNWNLHLPTKFDRNRLIIGWDMEIMPFSKWRPSAILSTQKLQFRSPDLYRHVILHLCSKFRVDRPINRRYIAKKRFSIWRPSAILDLLWRHHFVSENCVLRPQLRVKFSRRSVS